MQSTASRIVCLALVLTWSVPAYEAHADDPFYVVDTGPGPATAMAGDPIITVSQFQAAEFTLENDEVVVSIEGWLSHLALLGYLLVDVVVYGDAGDVPDTTDVLASELFSVPSGGTIPFPAGWHGAYELELELDAGTYWVSFEPPTDAFGTGALPPTPLQELDNYATGNPTTGFTGNDTLNLGVRIAVPEPEMWSGLAAGMLWLGALHRLRARRQGPGYEETVRAI